MKVFELMAKLAKAPAGAEVEFSHIMTLKEFTEKEIVDSDDGGDMYHISGTISSVESDECVAKLYMG